MTFLLKDIRDQLAASAAITDAFSDRIYAENAPQGAGYPRLHITDISNQPEYYLGGEAGYHTTMVQVDVWTDGTGGKFRANELGELVRNRLSGYRGQFGTGCYGTARLERNDSIVSPPGDSSDQNRFRYSMDFEIKHSAAVPTFT